MRSLEKQIFFKACFKIGFVFLPVNKALGVGVADGMHELGEDASCLAFSEVSSLDNVVKKLARSGVLHHKVDFVLGHDDLVELCNVVVAQMPPRVDLAHDQWRVRLFHDFDGDLLIGWDVCGHPNDAVGPLAHLVAEDVRSDYLWLGQGEERVEGSAIWLICKKKG